MQSTKKPTMACQKGKADQPKPKPGFFRCKKCKSVAEKKKSLCKPKVIKK
jgi:hypothetical protein